MTYRRVVERSGRLRWLAALSCLLCATSVWSQEDVVIVENGDAWNGEIKSLDRGLLQFDTDATGVVSIEWTYVTQLQSIQNFLVELDDGRQLFGSWSVSQVESMLRLETQVGPLDLPLLSIVRMTPIEGRLIDRIDMSVDLGYNITKANNVRQKDFSYSFAYRTEERLVSANLDASESSSSSDPKSLRSNNTFGYRRFVPNREWDPSASFAVERNDELGLDRRATLGGGMSRWITDTNSRRVSFTGGLVYTVENETNAVDTEEIVEASLGLRLDWFRYEAPEFDVIVRFDVFERLTDSKRTRGNLDVDLRWELVNDFFWGFSVYYTFNTKPTGDETSSKDYGLVTSLGWSF